MSEKLETVIKNVSAITDLGIETVRDLLTSGWSFVQELDKPDRWERTY